MMRTTRWMMAILVVIVTLAARTPGAQAQGSATILVAVPGVFGDQLLEELQARLEDYLPTAPYHVEHVGRFIRDAQEAVQLAMARSGRTSLIVWAAPQAPTVVHNTFVIQGMERVFIPIGSYTITTSPPLALIPGDAAAVSTYARLTVGQAAYLFGYSQEALLALNAALMSAPDNWPGLGEIYYYRATCYALSSGNIQIVLENLYSAIAAGDAWYYYSAIAWTHFNAGEVQRAIDFISTAITLAPDNAGLYLDRAHFFEQVDNYAAAIQDYDAALEIAPQILQIYQRRAEAAYTLGDYATALEDYSQLIGMTGDHVNIAPFLQRRAEIYLAMQDYASALADLDHVMEINPNPTALFTHGLTHLYMQNFDAAIADLQAYTAQHPEDPAGWTNLAQAHEGAGNTFSAIDAYQTALVLDGEATYLYGDLARLYYGAAQTFDTGSVEQANYLDLGIAAAGLALADNPNDLDAHLYRALVYMIRRQNELALEDLNATLIADPASEDALYNRGIVYTRLGDTALNASERQTLWAAAVADYDALLDIDFDRYNYLLVYQGYLYVQMDAFSSALDAFAAYDRLYPNAASTPVDTYFRAQAYAGTGDFDRALDAYVTVINGDNPYYACQARLATGLILGHELNDPASGVYHLEHYLERPCTTNPIHVAVVRLYLAAWERF
jgi:tetratricopeptide (TPR) repeat protein